MGHRDGTDHGDGSSDRYFFHKVWFPMAHPRTELYVHLVWSTWDRMPLITPAVEDHIYAALAAKCQELGCEALAINGIPDHVHGLVRLSPTVPVAQLVGEMKGASSHLVTHHLQRGEFFKWQGSYSAFSVSPRALPVARAYILNQKQRHRDKQLLSVFEPDSRPTG
jgi:REP element-mobilizing transposase RayT